MASPNTIAPKSNYKAQWRSPADKYAAGVKNRDEPLRSPPNKYLLNYGHAQETPPTAKYSPVRPHYLLPTGAKPNLIGNACLQRSPYIANKPAMVDVARIAGGSPPGAHYSPARPAAGSVYAQASPTKYDSAIPKARSPPQKGYLGAGLFGYQNGPLANARSPVKQPGTPVVPPAPAARQQPGQQQQSPSPVDLTRKRWNIDFKESDVVDADCKAWPANWRPAEKRRQKLGEDKNANAVSSADVIVKEEEGDEAKHRALGMDTLHFDSAQYNAYHAARLKECDTVPRTQGALAGSDNWRTMSLADARDEHAATGMQRFANGDDDRRYDTACSSTANGTHALDAPTFIRAIDHARTTNSRVASTAHATSSPAYRFSHATLTRASASDRETECSLVADSARLTIDSRVSIDPGLQSVPVTVSRVGDQCAPRVDPLTREYQDGPNVELRHVESCILSSMSDADNLSVHSRASQRSRDKDACWVARRGSAENAIVEGGAPSTSSQVASEAGHSGTRAYLDERPSDHKSSKMSEPYAINKGETAVAGGFGMQTATVAERGTLAEWETRTKPDSSVVRRKKLCDVSASSSAVLGIHRKKSLEATTALVDEAVLLEQKRRAETKLRSEDEAEVHPEIFPLVTVVEQRLTEQSLSNVMETSGARGGASSTATRASGDAALRWTMKCEEARKEHEEAAHAHGVNIEEKSRTRKGVRGNAPPMAQTHSNGDPATPTYSAGGSPLIAERSDGVVRDAVSASTHQIVEPWSRLQSDHESIAGVCAPKAYSTRGASSRDDQRTCKTSENAPQGVALPTPPLPPCTTTPHGANTSSLSVRDPRAQDAATCIVERTHDDDASWQAPPLWDDPPHLSRERHLSDWCETIPEGSTSTGQNNGPRYDDRSTGGSRKSTDGMANGHPATSTQRSPNGNLSQRYSTYGNKVPSNGRHTETSKRSPVSGGHHWVSPRDTFASTRTRPSSGGSTTESVTKKETVADIVARNEKRERKQLSRRDEGLCTSVKLSDSIIVPKPKIAQVIKGVGVSEGEVVLESRTKHRDRERSARRDIGAVTFQALASMEERLGILYSIADKMESWSRDVLHPHREAGTKEVMRRYSQLAPESDGAAFLAKVKSQEDFVKKMCGHINGSPPGAIRECKDQISASLDAFADLLDILQKGVT